MQHTITEHYTKYYPEMLAFSVPLHMMSRKKTDCTRAGLIIWYPTTVFILCRVRPQKNGRVDLAVSGSGKPFVFELNTERKRRVIRSVTEQSCAVIKSEFAENR